MAVATETLSCRPRIGMASIAVVPIVVVPGTSCLQDHVGGTMEARVGAAKTVVVTMAAGAGAGWISRVMTGSAVFYIAACRPAVIGAPGRRRMQQREQALPLVAVVAEALPVMTGSTIKPLALGIQSMRKPVVEIMNGTVKIVSSVAIEAGGTPPMTLHAPLAIDAGIITMLVSPIRRMNLLQRYVVTVAESARSICLQAIVTGQACSH